MEQIPTMPSISSDQWHHTLATRRQAAWVEQLACNMSAVSTPWMSSVQTDAWKHKTPTICPTTKVAAHLPGNIVLSQPSYQIRTMKKLYVLQSTATFQRTSLSRLSCNTSGVYKCRVSLFKSRKKEYWSKVQAILSNRVRRKTDNRFISVKTRSSRLLWRHSHHLTLQSIKRRHWKERQVLSRTEGVVVAKSRVLEACVMTQTQLKTLWRWWGNEMNLQSSATQPQPRAFSILILWTHWVLISRIDHKISIGKAVPNQDLCRVQAMSHKRKRSWIASPRYFKQNVPQTLLLRRTSFFRQLRALDSHHSERDKVQREARSKNLEVTTTLNSITKSTEVGATSTTLMVPETTIILPWLPRRWNIWGTPRSHSITVNLALWPSLNLQMVRTWQLRTQVCYSRRKVYKIGTTLSVWQAITRTSSRPARKQRPRAIKLRQITFIKRLRSFTSMAHRAMVRPWLHHLCSVHRPR